MEFVIRYPSTYAKFASAARRFLSETSYTVSKRTHAVLIPDKTNCKIIIEFNQVE